MLCISLTLCDVRMIILSFSRTRRVLLVSGGDCLPAVAWEGKKEAANAQGTRRWCTRYLGSSAQRLKLPAVRIQRTTSILVAPLSAGSNSQEPLSDPFTATIKDFLMWCGQRAVQVGQNGLPVSCIFRRSPGVADALQSLVLQFRV